MLGGLLAGVTVSGVLMAIFQSNAGGAWDNAKKMVEEGVEIDGKKYAKGSDVHTAAVVGDTVGDPFKDTSGPSLNILLKLMSVVALVIAPSIAMTVSSDDKVVENIEVSEGTSVSVVDGKVEAVVTKEVKDLIVNREVMTVKDPENPTDFELKHTPEIIFGDVDSEGMVEVYVKVGSKGVVHPNDENHWIDIVSIYSGGLVSSEKYKNNNNTEFGPYLIKVNKGDKVRVAIGCNLHGFWSNEVVYE